MDAVGKGGELMIFGVSPGGDKASYEPFRIYNEEITVVGSMAVLTSYGRAVDIVAAGGVDAARGDRHLDLDGFADALEAVGSVPASRPRSAPTADGRAGALRPRPSPRLDDRTRSGDMNLLDFDIGTTGPRRSCSIGPGRR